MTAPSFTCTLVETSRLATNVWSSGPEDGVPILLVHGNLSTGGYWRYVAEALGELADDVRVIAPDLRGFGRTEALPIDATRGLGDMVEDVHALLDALGLADECRVIAAGWSMGAGVLEQLMVEHPDDLAGVVLVAPLSPHGFGGTVDAAGTPAFDDGASTGGGAANADFVRRLAAKDAGDEDPQSSPRVVMRTFYGPGANAGDVDEDFLVDELLLTRTGDDFYPGDSTPSENWPGVAPGTRGVLNTMAPTHFDATAIVDLERKPPVTWVHGTADQVVSDTSLFDLATLGSLGAVPGWPGSDVLPSQPMVAQMRAVLKRYAAAGGAIKEVALEGIGHGIPLEVPAVLAREIEALITD
jgi:pimeloyl-ACP methyl ester carboxylesterase